MTEDQRLAHARRHGFPAPIPGTHPARETWFRNFSAGLANPAAYGLTDFRPPANFRAESAACSAHTIDIDFYGYPWTVMTGTATDTGLDYVSNFWPMMFLTGYTGANCLRRSYRARNVRNPENLGDADWTVRRAFWIFGNIDFVCPGGIQWNAPMDRFQREFAEWMFCNQMGAMLELYFPDLDITVERLELNYPQVYVCRCPFCGEEMALDFWGFPIRASDKKSLPILNCHRCEQSTGRYYTDDSYYHGDKPSKNERRDAAQVVQNAQLIYFRIQTHWVYTLLTELFYDRNWDRDPRLWEPTFQPDLHTNRIDTRRDLIGTGELLDRAIYDAP